MYQKSFMSALALFVCSVQATEEVFPSLEVTVDGEPMTLYVHNPVWSAATVADDSVEFGHNNRMYLSKSSTNDTSKYFTPNLLGGYMEYDVDLSKVGCGCITALYGVMMPAIDNVDDPFQYCGAGTSAKAACPEFDIMEANSYGFRSTSHRCPPPVDGVYNDCDSRGQCTVDALRLEQDKQYGPGAEYAIDSTREFTVRSDYQESDDRWTAFTITLKQDGREVVMTDGDCTYLNPMSWQIRKGMTFVLSNWSPSNTSWIEHGTCENTGCDKENTLSTFKNLRFSTSGAIAPPVDYETYKYGSTCTEETKSLATSECDSACDNCNWSWPIEDPAQWNSEEAACRCVPRQRAPQGYTYAARECVDKRSGLCKPDDCDCRWSWPSDDPTKWKSEEGMCRCKPEDREMEFGGSCNNTYTGECGQDCTSCHWAWPADDEAKWDSEDANCHCPASDIKEIKWGGNCGGLGYGECGSYCRECRWSWLQEDEDQWEGESANCRCKNWWGA